MSNISASRAQDKAALYAEKAFHKTHDVEFNKNGEAVLVKKPGVQLLESNNNAAREQAAKMSRYD